MIIISTSILKSKVFSQEKQRKGQLQEKSKCSCSFLIQICSKSCSSPDRSVISTDRTSVRIFGDGIARVYKRNGKHYTNTQENRVWTMTFVVIFWSSTTSGGQQFLVRCPSRLIGSGIFRRSAFSRSPWFFKTTILLSIM